MMACRYLWLIASACLTTALHAPHRRGATLPRRATAAYASVAAESPASADAPVASSVEHVLAADAPPLVLADHDVAPLAAKEALPPADAPPLADAAVAPVEAPASSFIDRHPLAAKSLSMGITYGLADTAAQFFGRVAHGEIVPLALRLRRGVSLSLVGCLAVGPLLAAWFDSLERWVPGKNKRAIFARTVLDQAIEVPVMISIIFSLSSLAEGHGLAFCLAKIQSKLLKTWRDCVGVWFPVQFVNQGFVPLKYRVIFQAVISFFWDAYLSIVSHA